MYSSDIKAAFAEAVEQTIAKYPEQFAGKIDEAKRVLHAHLNKYEIALALEYVGVTNQNEIAQTIISTGHRILATKK